MLLANFADDVRALPPGGVVSRVRRSTVDDWRDDSDRNSFSAYVTKMRKETGYALVMETLAPHLTSDGHVLRCYTVTRLS